jgi:hypothetical protein
MQGYWNKVLLTISLMARENTALKAYFLKETPATKSSSGKVFHFLKILRLLIFDKKLRQCCQLPQLWHTKIRTYKKLPHVRTVFPPYRPGLTISI